MSWPTLLVEIAFGDAPLVALASNTWVDVTSYVVSISTRRGRSDALSRIEAGTATIVLDNSDRRFDPTFASGAYYPNVVPMKKIRISATYAAVTYRLFTGFVSSWPPDWPGGLDVQTTIGCVDAFTYFARVKLNGAFSNEFTGNSVNTWMDNIGWPVADRQIYFNAAQIQGGTFVNTPALQHFQNVADIESGLFFMEGNGQAFGQDRYWRLTQSRTPVATFGDAASGELPWLKLSSSYDDSQIWNEARVTRTGGVEQVATDTTSQAAYFTRTLTRQLPLSSDTEALALAQYLVALYGPAVFRFTSMTLDGLMDDTLWPYMLGLAISNRITVKQRPPPITAAIQQDGYVESISHDIRADDRGTFWYTTFSLSSAEALAGSSFWIVEDSVYGVLDSTTRLGY